MSSELIVVKKFPTLDDAIFWFRIPDGDDAARAVLAAQGRGPTIEEVAAETTAEVAE